jgi:ribosomal protein L37AE/L43A
LIKKPRSKPLKIPFCEAAMARLDPSHPKYQQLANDYGSFLSGYYGERNLDYYLSTLPEKDYFIFHGLRLKNDVYHFQLDTLIVSKHLPYILEGKNLTGKLFLDTPLNQLIQTKGDTQEVYPCPVLQSERQQSELQKWLSARNFPNFPVEKMVVFTHKKALIVTHPDHREVYRSICKPADVVNRLVKAEKGILLELTGRQMKKLIQLLLKNHVPVWSCQFLEEYKIQMKEIKPGVQCPECKMLGMVYVKGIWKCLRCHTLSKTAHEKAIFDYFILLKPSITNSELRNFLSLPSARVANRILLSLNLPFSGEKKGRVYHAPEIYPFFQ